MVDSKICWLVVVTVIVLSHGILLICDSSLELNKVLRASSDFLNFLLDVG